MLVSKEQTKVAKLASSDGSRPVLQQVKVFRQDGKVIVAATDSYMLAEVVEETPKLEDFPTLPDTTLKQAEEVLVPASVMLELGKKLKAKNVLPVLGYGVVEKGKVVTTDLDTSTILGFQEIEGKYPDYRKLIDNYKSKGKVTLTINPKLLAKALTLFGSEASIQITMHVESDGQAAKLDPLLLTSDEMGVAKTVVVMPLKS